MSSNVYLQKWAQLFYMGNSFSQSLIISMCAGRELRDKVAGSERTSHQSAVRRNFDKLENIYVGFRVQKKITVDIYNTSATKKLNESVMPQQGSSKGSTTKELCPLNEKIPITRRPNRNKVQIHMNAPKLQSIF